MICSSTNWRTISRIAFCSSVFSKNANGHRAILSRELHPRRRRSARPAAPARWSSWRATARRREWTFGELASAARSARRHACTRAASRRGDVVLTLIGNRPEWAITMLACFRQGYVVLPCTEQLRPKDLAAAAGRRAAAARSSPTRATRTSLAGWSGDTLWVPFDDASHTPPPPAELQPDDPCLITFTSGTARRAEGRPARPALPDRPAPAGRALARARPRPARVVHGRRGLVEVRPQRVHRALAARRRGAAARRPLRPARAAGADRARARRRALHGPDRVPRDRQARDARPLLAAARASSPPARRSTPRSCTPGTRRPASGSATATARPRPASSPARRWARRRAPGSMGRPLPGVELDVVDGELVLAPAHRPHVLPALPRRRSRTRARGSTGDRVTQDEDGYLHFEGRTDDVIISAGYRIGPFEVESALVAHEAVAEAAVVAAPDDERGSVVRAVVVLRDGYAPSDDARARAAGPRQGPDRAVQVPAHRRLRGGPAQDAPRARSAARRCAALRSRSTRSTGKPRRRRRRLRSSSSSSTSGTRPRATSHRLPRATQPGRARRAGRASRSAARARAAARRAACWSANVLQHVARSAPGSRARRAARGSCSQQHARRAAASPRSAPAPPGVRGAAAGSSSSQVIATAGGSGRGSSLRRQRRPRRRSRPR